MFRTLARYIAKARSLATSRRVYLLSAIVIVASAVFIYEWTIAHQKQVAAVKITSAHQQLAAKSTPVATSKPVPNVAPTPQPAPASQVVSTLPAIPTKKSAPAPKPAPAPQPQTVDFTLSPPTVIIALGAVSPNLQAISANGQAIWWGVLGGNGISVTEGLVSNSAEVVHNFKLSPSVDLVKPGTYQMNIMGYIPRGPSVTKQLTIIITPMAGVPQN